MGMCASQARLLTLTSLKSDCELQAQKINNDREALARTQEKLMTKYTDKINNKKLTVRVTNNDGVVNYDNLTAENLFKAGYTVVIDGKEYKKADALDSKYKKSTVGEVNNALQAGIINGDIILKKKNSATGIMEEVSYSAESAIVEDYYDADDAAAKAEYDAEMSKTQRKDKSLELQLEQIETKHKALETEIASIQKVITSNIENTYNTFSKQ